MAKKIYRYNELKAWTEFKTRILNRFQMPKPKEKKERTSALGKLIHYALEYLAWVIVIREDKMEHVGIAQLEMFGGTGWTARATEILKEQTKHKGIYGIYNRLKNKLADGDLRACLRTMAYGQTDSGENYVSDDSAWDAEIKARCKEI